jgi:hypothetical protein
VGEVCRPATGVRSAVQNIKKLAVSLNVHQIGGHPNTGIPEILDTEANIAEI